MVLLSAAISAKLGGRAGSWITGDTTVVMRNEVVVHGPTSIVACLSLSGSLFVRLNQVAEALRPRVTVDGVEAAQDRGDFVVVSELEGLRSIWARSSIIWRTSSKGRGPAGSRSRAIPSPPYSGRAPQEGPSPSGSETLLERHQIVDQQP